MTGISTHAGLGQRARQFTRSVTGVLFVLAASSLASAEPPAGETILAHVNGEAVTLQDLNLLLATQQQPGFVEEIPPSLSPEGLLQRTIQNRLLEQEGYRIEAEKRPEVHNQVWDLKRHKGMLALLDSVSANAHAYQAEELVAAMQQTNTIQRVSQILLNDEATARTMMQSLEDGAKFADLADLHSVDTTSVIQAGGDIGWVRKDMFIPEFSEALADLSPGEYAEPFQTDVGWHILQLTDTREETVGQSDAMVIAVKEKAKGEQVMQSIRAYIESLMSTQGVVVDSSLLASLDYGSKDPAVANALMSNDGLLAKLPWRDLRVSDLSQEIRFEHFHGLEGKPDAAELRDKTFDEWITQLLLRHEATAQGFDRRPALLAEAEALERRLLREAVLTMILKIKFAPSEDEVRAYYDNHLMEFAPQPRIRANGIFVSDQTVAGTLQEMLGQGARMNWLAANTLEVVDANPKFFSGWIDPAALKLSGSELSRGTIIDPVQVGDVWAVAEILEVEPTAPAPLEECRGRVLGKLQGKKRAEAVRDAVKLLESSAEIKVEKNAPELVTSRIEAWLGISTSD